MIKKLDTLAVLFLILSGLVWGVFGLYRLNIVEYVFDREWVIRIVYILFGASFIYHLITFRKETKRTKAKR